jgi:hypothetical protein
LVDPVPPAPLKGTGVPAQCRRRPGASCEPHGGHQLSSW